MAVPPLGRVGGEGVPTSQVVPLEGRIPTHVAGLDVRLGGGIPRGHIVLVAGPPGSLKSTFAYRILFREARDNGASCLYLSMEQSHASLEAQMRSLGMDPLQAKGVHVIDVRALRREIEELREQPRWLLGLRRQLARYKGEVGCDLLCLDSLDALYALTPFENPRNEIFQFFEELRDLGATTFLVSEMPRDSVRFAHYGVEEFLADTIVHLRMKEVDVGVSTSVRRYVGVVKMRGVDHDLDYFPLLVEDGEFEIVSE
jgi:circadian clock protein KaiC